MKLRMLPAALVCAGLTAGLAPRAATARPICYRTSDRIVFKVEGPRPSRIWRLEGPFRLVVDFPGRPMPGYQEFPRTETGTVEGLIAMRRGLVQDDGQLHSRLTLVFVKPPVFTSAWQDSVLTLNVRPMDTTLAALAGPAAPAAKVSAHGRKPAAKIRNALNETPAARQLRVLDRVRDALAHANPEAAALALLALPADAVEAAPLYARLALMEAAMKRSSDLVEEHAREALRRGTENVPLDLCLARALDREGKSQDATSWFRRATQIRADADRTDADRRTAYFLWADGLYRESRTEDALSAYQEAIDSYPQAPECPWGLYQIVKLQQRLGRLDEARATCARLLRDFSGDYWATQARSRFVPVLAAREAR
jgi:tetratricopeptide (TPR) repeat protein